MTKLAIFEITDGTDTVSFLTGSQGVGFHLQDWSPRVIGLKGGGIYQDSSIAPGRRLAFGVDEDVIETLDLKINGYGQDDLIEIAMRLTTLLRKARNYWLSDWQNTPVYLVARSARETNTRYALVKNYSLDQLSNPYAAPFFVAQEIVAMDDITLGIERSHWLESIPGESTAVSISAQQQASPSLGRTATTALQVYFNTRGNTANVTHIFVDNGGVFTDESPPAGLPFDLLPDPLAQNDALYIGSTTGPFSNVIFDVGTAAVGVSGTWEMWTGAAWFGLAGGVNLLDNTAGFTNTGVNGIFFNPQAGWVTNVVNAVDAYWIRFRQFIAPGAHTVPTQRNRDIYFVTKAFVEAAATQVPGDVPPLAMLQVYNRSHDDGNLPTFHYNRIIYGLRSVSRGSAFNAYLNVAQSQNPAGVTAAISGANTSFISSVIDSPVGQHGRWSPPGAAATIDTRFTVTLDDTILQEYYGVYHVFLRTGDLTTLAGGSVAKVRLRIDYDESTSFMTREVNLNLTSGFFQNLADMGQVSLQHDIDNTEQIVINIQASQDDATGASLNFIDLIFIPVDESAVDATTVTIPSIALPLTNIDSFIEIESLRRFKNPANIRGVLKTTPADRIRALMTLVNSGPAILQSSSQQRIWFLTAVFSNGVWLSNWNAASRMQLRRNARYSLLRGDN